MGFTTRARPSSPAPFPSIPQGLKPHWLAAGALLLAASQVASAASWDLSGDFSSTDNPNGAWQYGYTLGAAADFRPFVGHTSLPNGVVQWWDGIYADAEPSVSFNPTAVPADAGRWILGPQEVALQPGPGGEWAVVRWTTPADGEYQLDASFAALGAGSVRIVSISVAGGGTLGTGTLEDTGQRFDLAGRFPLLHGQGLDFAVGPGADGAAFDGTSVAVHISAVPEVPSAVLASLGAAVIAGVRAGRRRPERIERDPRCGSCRSRA